MQCALLILFFLTSYDKKECESGEDFSLSNFDSHKQYNRIWTTKIITQNRIGLKSQNG